MITKLCRLFSVLRGNTGAGRAFFSPETNVACLSVQCDGRPIPLPSLQGIAVLNIPSYAGGTNFWGGTKEDDVSISMAIQDNVFSLAAAFEALAPENSAWKKRSGGLSA